MKFERWRRRTARPWLLLRPGTHGETWQWARVEQGRVQASGVAMPPAIPGARVALVLPGASCSHFQVAAPPGLKRHEWPLLLEDRLLQGAQQVTCGCLAREPGAMRLVCVEQALLDGWLAQCAEWQLDVQRCWAQFQLLPVPSSGSAWCWRQNERLSLFVGSDSEARQHWLAWPVELQTATPGGIWAELETQPVEGEWPEVCAALDGMPSLFERRRPLRQSRQLGPGFWRLPAVCLALAVLWAGLWCSQQWRQQGMYQAQVEDVVGPVASLREATQRVKQQRLGADERQLRLRQLEHLQSELDGWLRANGSWQLSGAEFDGQRWTLQLQGHETIDESPWQAMASALGVAVQVTQGSDQVKLTFDLGAAS